MKNQDNHSKQYRIYLKSSHQWVDVSEAYYRDHSRFYDTFRKREQWHGRCSCPKNKFWCCNADCPACEFQCAGDSLSLDHIVSNEEGDGISMMDTLADPAPLIADVVADADELTCLFARLSEIMPEAIQIGELRQEGLSDEAIAEAIGVKRTTFLSRLKKAKEKLAAEFPDLF